MTGRVLVVDDEPQVLSLFATILQEGGYSVLLASSGEYVLKALRETVVDLVVLDLSMPQPDGFELLKTLRLTMPGMRILVVSGFLDGVLLGAAQLLGASATLAKADAAEKLLPTVDRLLQRYPPAA